MSLPRPDDEIADLIDRVRASSDLDVGLVVPASSRALQTPLNVRLLAQFSNQSGRRTSVVTEDPRLQQLARASGLQVYGSVPAFERGIELSGPRFERRPRRPRHARRRRRSSGLLLQSSSRPRLRRLRHRRSPRRRTPRPPHGWSPGACSTQMPPAKRSRGWDRRRFLYVAGAAVAIIGIVLFMTLAPSAKITITIDATPLSVSPTIQGSTSATAATLPDHVLTGVVTGQAQSSFVATPTGTLNVPAVAATAKVVFSTNNPDGFQFSLPSGNEIELSGGGAPFSRWRTRPISASAPTGTRRPSGVCNGGSKPNAISRRSRTPSRRARKSRPGQQPDRLAQRSVSDAGAGECRPNLPGIPYAGCFGAERTNITPSPSPTRTLDSGRERDHHDEREPD